MRACLLVLLLARPGFGEDVDQLKKAVADVDPAVRLEAVKKLRAMGPRAAPAVEVLVDAAYDESREVQIDAIRALRAVGPAARDAVHPLQELRGFDNVLLRHVQLALNAIGTAGVPAPKLKGAGKEALLAALKSEDARTRSVLVQGAHEYGKIALAVPINYEVPNLVPDAVPPNIGYLAQSFQIDDIDEIASACAAVGAEVFSAQVEIDLPGRGKCRSMIVRNPGSGALQELFQVI